MASVWKHPNSNFWSACFYDHQGKRRKRSTKQTERKKAQKVADALEQTYRRRQSEATARKLIAQAVEETTGQSMRSSSVRRHCIEWLDQKGPEVSKASFDKYQTSMNHFLEFLGSTADEDLNYLTKQHVVEFRNDLHKRYSPSSVNLTIKTIRSILKSAVEDGFANENPAASVKLVGKGEQKDGKQAFSLDQVRSLLKVADSEWRGIILAGLYTGQRLGDVIRLNWSKVDLQNQMITLQTGKTRRSVSIPIAPPLMNWLLENVADNPTAPLFPSSFATLESIGSVSPFSRRFYNIMVAAGIAEPRKHTAAGNGRDGRREVSQFTFHSLRHTATSLLKNAGVSDVVARDLIGHESAAVSRVYTHVSDEAKREAMARLPGIEL